MKSITGTWLLLVLSIWQAAGEVSAQAVSSIRAHIIAANYLQIRHPHQIAGTAEVLLSDNDTVAWLVRCAPTGFVVVPVTDALAPILAWSDEGTFGEGEAWKSFLPLFTEELRMRKQYAAAGNMVAGKISDAWAYWSNPAEGAKLFEQWPPEGWSPTGGWLQTNWTQTAPYNAMCPVDGQTQQRSVAGCPATAMAQIVHYHRRTNSTRFSDADDYYHNFGANNKYWIDDDWASHGFPSWEQLNLYLDTLDMHFEQGAPLKNSDKAALTYACGVAAKQVYSSSVSGTYGINQAWDAFVRFGYEDAKLVYPTEPELNAMLTENIKIALPAQLGLVNPDQTAGHNVVVDGYNTDELYHFNFGWGGSANGWYTMPPENIPYQLTVIEGIVLDINLSNSTIGMPETVVITPKPQLFYDAIQAVLHIALAGEGQTCTLQIVNSAGKLQLQQQHTTSSGNQDAEVSLGHLPKGFYLASLKDASGSSRVLKFVR